MKQKRFIMTSITIHRIIDVEFGITVKDFPDYELAKCERYCNNFNKFNEFYESAMEAK